jgi:hypothetical protein
MTSAPDPALVQVCGRERRCLVTLDLDFANPLRFRPADYAGIVVLRARTRPTATALVDLMKTLAEAVSTSRASFGLWSQVRFASTPRIPPSLAADSPELCLCRADA